MWECPECGCLAIAADLEICPQCLKPRPAPDAGEPVEEDSKDA